MISVEYIDPLLEYTHTANVDYTQQDIQLTFSAGDLLLTSSLNPINDNRVEGNENVQLTATVTQGLGSFTPNGNTATVVIQDDDSKINSMASKIHTHTHTHIFTHSHTLSQCYQSGLIRRSMMSMR